MSTPHGPKKKRGPGRPKPGDAPKVNYDELDRLLVFGEIVDAGKGKTKVSYPSYRDVAKRFDVSTTFVAEYARANNCMGRRDETAHVIEKKADALLIERRARAIALSREEELKIADAFLIKFGEAVEDGRVRCDNPADFDRIVRLKEFIRGGADSRTEVQATVSLDALQMRYLRMQKGSGASPEERGEPVLVEAVASVEVLSSPAAVGGGGEADPGEALSIREADASTDP
jgi:hypothetical protein